MVIVVGVLRTALAETDTEILLPSAKAAADADENSTPKKFAMSKIKGADGGVKPPTSVISTLMEPCVNNAGGGDSVNAMRQPLLFLLITQASSPAVDSLQRRRL